MTINNVSVNVNAAASALTKYLNEVEKIAEKVNLSVEDTDMIIRLSRKNLKFQEVVQITGEPVNETKENAAEPAPVATQNIFDLDYIASHEEAYKMIDVNKVVYLDNVKVRKENACDTFKAVLAGLRKIGVKEVHYRFWSEPSEGINSLAKQSAMTVIEGKRSEDQERRYFYYKENAKKNVKAQQAPMPEEPKKAKYMSDANMASLEASAPARVSSKETIMAAAKRLAATKVKPAPVSKPVAAPALEKDTQKQMSVEDYANEILAEPEQVAGTVTVVDPAPVASDTTVVENTFMIPSFEEMIGFGSVSTYIEKDGEMVVDDGKDEEELTEEKRDELLAGVPLNGYTEERTKKISDIPEMDAADTTLMVSPRVR